MQRLIVFLCLLSASLTAAPPSFEKTGNPAGWTVTAGDVAPGDVLAAGPNGVTLVSDGLLDLPMEVRLQARVPQHDAWFDISVLPAEGTQPWLFTQARLTGRNQRGAASLRILAQADGKPMATEAVSSRTWSIRDKPRGVVTYRWRFPKALNIWADADRQDIGAAYAALTPLDEKLLTYRLVLRPESRQIWLDGRLVAESREPITGQAKLKLALRPGSEIHALTVSPLPAAAPERIVVPLADYFHEPGRQAVDLSQSLYRYRLTYGIGPDAPYVNANRTWPDAFAIDPAIASFRVPYRPYQTVWLEVLVPTAAPAYAVPEGVFRFYREDAGLCATTPFAITAETIASGQAKHLRDTPEGPVYQVRVPVDTAALYGLRDMADQFLEFQLTKPLALSRSYPDPIYYGDHPAGPPSSLQVLGIELEPAPFDFEVVPEQAGHLFVQPEQPTYRVIVSNHRGTPIRATMTLAADTLDGHASSRAELGPMEVAADGRVEAKLELPVSSLGWHRLRATVEAAGVTRAADLSMVMLPPDTRTYGDSVAETRVGTWNLWGHYTAFGTDVAANEPYLALLRKLGLRRIGAHGSFLSFDQLKKYDFMPKGPLTAVSVYHRLNEKDPEAVKKMVEAELAQMEPLETAFPGQVAYYYGGEWGPSRETTHAVYPLYQGQPERPLTEAELKNVERQTFIFTTIGRAMREKFPNVKLILQWGSPTGTIPFLRQGFPKELVDGFGMDQPMFERLPENLTDGSIAYTLWQLRAEAKRQGWPRLPIFWTEGPFLPTNEGALTEQEQADYQIRYLLLGIAYGIERFDAGVVPFQAGNYYGSEHYGAGVFERPPLVTPKLAVPAINTATTMLCGAEYVGPLPTDSLDTFAMRFKRADGSSLVALWRVRGEVKARLTVAGNAILMLPSGEREPLTAADGAVSLTVGPSPVWVTAPGDITACALSEPTYTEAPADISLPLGGFAADGWQLDSADEPHYTNHHFGVARAAEPAMTAAFGTASPHGPAAVVTLPEQPGNAPLLARYTALVAKAPIAIPGKASHLGIWVDGNAGFGRFTYQLRDAKGEIWLSAGAANDWNGDDIHGWSAIAFTGWRYVRFPLPGNHPWDLARETESTWWGSRGGDGIVDYPLSLERLYVEARNEVPYLGEMTLVPDRDIQLAGLTAEYVTEADRDPASLARYAIRRETPTWAGPQENPIAELRQNGVGEPPVIDGFTEPHHWADGRRMIIHFDQQEGATYNLYLSLYEDGRGAELINNPRLPLKTNEMVHGLKPDTPLFLFLTRVVDGQESKPSPAYKLITRDNFAEK